MSWGPCAAPAFSAASARATHASTACSAPGESRSAAKHWRTSRKRSAASGPASSAAAARHRARRSCASANSRSEEHTSELQSRGHLVCRLLLEKKKHNDEQYLV